MNDRDQRAREAAYAAKQTNVAIALGQLHQGKSTRIWLKAHLNSVRHSPRPGCDRLPVEQPAPPGQGARRRSDAQAGYLGHDDQRCHQGGVRARLGHQGEPSPPLATNFAQLPRDDQAIKSVLWGLCRARGWTVGGRRGDTIEEMLAKLKISKEVS